MNMRMDEHIHLPIQILREALLEELSLVKRPEDESLLFKNVHSEEGTVREFSIIREIGGKYPLMVCWFDGSSTDRCIWVGSHGKWYILDSRTDYHIGQSPNKGFNNILNEAYMTLASERIILRGDNG